MNKMIDEYMKWNGALIDNVEDWEFRVQVLEEFRTDVLMRSIQLGAPESTRISSIQQVPMFSEDSDTSILEVIKLFEIAAEACSDSDGKTAIFIDK